MNTFFRYLVSIVALLLSWKLAAMALSVAAFPPPDAVFSALGQAMKSLIFWVHFGASGWRVVAAVITAWVIAFPLGVFLGMSRRVDNVLAPTIFMTYPIPKIVLLPIVLMLFGLGDASKIFMIALIVGYQILVATRDRVMNLEKKYLDAFQALGGSQWQAVRHVIIPAALPEAFTALRISTGTAVAVLFFVESFATQRGLGYWIMDTWGRADFEKMFVGIIGLSVLGVALYEICNYLEKNFCAWNYVITGRKASMSASSGLIGRINLYGRMIKFSHTIFALPFALSAVILAQRQFPLTAGLLAWIVVAMAGARSAAMGFNRIVDARFDARNPRTATRAIPAGTLSLKAAWAFVGISSSAFVLAAAMISWLCFWLSFPVLAFLCFYSYTKRFTTLSHLYLGLAISLAPIGAWIAVTGSFHWPVLTLSVALLTYIAGFDILYSCQDVDFDQKVGLYSLPARYGFRAAFRISEGLHTLTMAALVAAYIAFDLGPVYLAALMIIAGLLVLEHHLVKPDDLANIDLAFFHVNATVSVILFLGVAGDEIVRRWL